MKKWNSAIEFNEDSTFALDSAHASSRQIGNTRWSIQTDAQRLCCPFRTYDFNWKTPVGFHEAPLQRPKGSRLEAGVITLIPWQQSRILTRRECALEGQPNMGGDEVYRHHLHLDKKSSEASLALRRSSQSRKQAVE